MKILPLASQSALFIGATHLVILDHTDLTETTAATAQTIQAIPVKAGTLARCIGTSLKTPFEDASDAAFNVTTLIAGDGDNDDRFLESQELNENGTEVLGKAGVAAAHVYVGDDTVDFKFAPHTGKSLSNIDTGEVWVFMQIVDLTRLHATA